MELGNQEESHVGDSTEKRSLGPGLLGLKKEGDGALDSTLGSNPA